MTAAFGDLSALAANLSYASGQGAELTAAELVRNSAEAIRREAAERAPKRTGALADSIAVVFTSPTSVIIGPTKKYGVFQEFGTGTRGEFKGQMYFIRPVRASRLHFKIDGKDIFAKEVKHPGIPPHPYMRPAIAAVLSKLQEDLGEAGIKLAMTKGT